MANNTLFADRNHITLDRTLVLGDVKYFPGDTVVVDAATAKSLLADFYGTVTSLEWDKGLTMHGPSVQFRAH